MASLNIDSDNCIVTSIKSATGQVLQTNNIVASSPMTVETVKAHPIIGSGSAALVTVPVKNKDVQDCKKERKVTQKVSSILKDNGLYGSNTAISSLIVKIMTEENIAKERTFEEETERGLEMEKELTKPTSKSSLLTFEPRETGMDECTHDDKNNITVEVEELHIPDAADNSIVKGSLDGKKICLAGDSSNTDLCDSLTDLITAAGGSVSNNTTGCDFLVVLEGAGVKKRTTAATDGIPETSPDFIVGAATGIFELKDVLEHPPKITKVYRRKRHHYKSKATTSSGTTTNTSLLDDEKENSTPKQGDNQPTFVSDTKNAGASFGTEDSPSDTEREEDNNSGSSGLKRKPDAPAVQEPQKKSPPAVQEQDPPADDDDDDIWTVYDREHGPNAPGNSHLYKPNPNKNYYRQQKKSTPVEQKPVANGVASRESLARDVNLNPVAMSDTPTLKRKTNTPAVQEPQKKSPPVVQEPQKKKMTSYSDKGATSTQGTTFSRATSTASKPLMSKPQSQKKRTLSFGAASSSNPKSKKKKKKSEDKTKKKRKTITAYSLWTADNPDRTDVDSKNFNSKIDKAVRNSYEARAANGGKKYVSLASFLGR